MDRKAGPLPEIIRFQRAESVITGTNGAHIKRKEYSLRADRSGKRLLLLGGIAVAFLLLGAKAVPGAMLALLRLL